MKISKAFEMTITYKNKQQPIKVSKDGYICLNDMEYYFPAKKLDNWLRSKNVREFIEVVENFLKPSGSRVLDFGTFGKVPEGLVSIYAKRGRYGGTYAHEYIAMKFAMWLSVEFELKVIQAYQNGTQRKSNWNIKRILAAENYKLMCDSIKNAHDPDMFYHYSNEAIMLNKIVFGKHEKNVRENANEKELETISFLEGRNSALIELGMEFKERRIILESMLKQKNRKRLDGE